MSAVVEVVTLARCAPERLFDLSLDMDAHTASLAHTGERATTSSGSTVLGLGDEVTFSARHFGVPWRLTARVHLVAPLGPLGRPVARWVLAPYLERLLRVRGAHLAAVAEHP